MQLFLIVLGCLFLVALLYIIFKDKIKILIVALGNKKRLQRNLFRGCKENDYLIINDLLIKIDENKYRHIDTLIFGNKYLYLVNEIVNIGVLKGNMLDNSWCLYYNDEMQLINNPFLENQRKIERIEKLIDLDRSNFKSIVLVADTIKVDNIRLGSNYEYLCSEKNIIKKIKIIEKNSLENDYDPKEVERYAKAFYLHSLECEKELKKQKKGRKK